MNDNNKYNNIICMPINNNNWLHEVEGMELAYLAIDSPLTASPVDRAQ